MTIVAKRKEGDSKAKNTGFGPRLRAIREAAGLSVAELASRAGMTPQTIAKYERGATPDPAWSTVQFLAVALGVSVSAFADESESELD